VNSYIREDEGGIKSIFMRGVVMEAGFGPPDILSGRFMAFSHSNIHALVETIQLVHLDCPSRGIVAPVTLMFVSNERLQVVELVSYHSL
jgi:hypothetical protein